MRYKSGIFLIAGLVSLTGGAALHSLKCDLIPGPSEQDLPVGVGGYGTFAADCLWLQTNLAWETQDEGRVRRLIDFTVTADPHTPYYWLNGARMLAYDLPAWQCQREPTAPLAVHVRFRTKGAVDALLLLERGQKWHGKSAVLHLEMANICLYALGDHSRAAEHYRMAAEQADAPDYAARLYARLRAEEIAGFNR